MIRIPMTLNIEPRPGRGNSGLGQLFVDLPRFMFSDHVDARAEPSNDQSGDRVTDR